MTTRKKLIAGNWKMFKTPAESAELTQSMVREAAAKFPEGGVDLLICPPFPSLAMVDAVLRSSQTRSAYIQLGAQNCFWEESGAYTGEVSAEMLKATGCTHVIIGHSERRSYFGETHETVQKKILAAYRASLTPIVCVGETLSQREEGFAINTVSEQVREAFKGIDPTIASKTVLAYEPVWAIGTGKTALPKDAEAMHQTLRSLWEALYGGAQADAVRILYGGSVNDKNALDLMAQANIDGALVGGASLKSESFLAIAQAALTMSH